MSGGDSPATVLVVDDEQEVADAYALRVDREYDARTAYGGEAALDAIDDDVDVVLLDRRMPDMSGDEVLEAIRAEGYDCSVVMVTAVAPDFDIIEMGFDDYLEKPVGPDALYEAIEKQLETFDRDAAISELFSVTAKVGVLEQQKSRAELDANDKYQGLKARADELREQIHGDEDEDGDGDAVADTPTADATSSEPGTQSEVGVTPPATANGGTEPSNTTDSSPPASPDTGSSSGMAFSVTTTGVAFALLLAVLLAGTVTSPMEQSTKMMVAGGQVLALVLALALGVKHGEYRASN